MLMLLLGARLLITVFIRKMASGSLSEQAKVWLIPSEELGRFTFKVSTFKPSQVCLIDTYQNVHKIKESNLDRYYSLFYFQKLIADKLRKRW